MNCQNKLIVYFKKREAALKWLTAASAYCLLFGFLEDPRVKTISLIGRDHLWLFLIYCVLMSVAMAVNIGYLYDRFGLKKKMICRLAFVFNAIFPLTLTTLMPSSANGGEVTILATVVHWIAGFGNIIVNAAAVLILSLEAAKTTGRKKMKAVCIVGSAVCIGDLLVFVLSALISHDVQKSKNGLFEIIPVAVILAVLYIVNHTDTASARKERDEKESVLYAADSSNFSALCFGLLCVAWASFTFYAFVRNPVHYTISMTGLEYAGGFNLVCLLLAAAFICNFIMMFKRRRERNGLIIALALIGSVSIVACMASPTSAEKNISPFHAVGALAFFYFLMAAFSLFMLKQRRRNKKYKLFFAGMLAVILGTLVTVVLLFVVFDQRYGRTGLTELIPLEYMFVFVLLENHTSYFDVRSEIEKEKTLSSVSA